MVATHPLTHTQTRELEAELFRERERLERALKPTSEGDGRIATLDITDTPSSIGVSLETQARGQYDAVVDALARLAAGTYGSCGSCGQPIPYGRLIVMPETTRCVSCPPHD